jgi:hypothetical protein
MKVAIVHEWLSTYAGSERVLEQMIACFPEADVFAVVDFLPEGERGFLQGKTPHVSFIQTLPLARKYFRHYLPLMPLAVEQFDLSGYDLILSNNHAVAKGVIVGPDQLHMSYVQSPMRYAWDLQSQYLREAGLDWGVKSWLVRWLLHRMRSYFLLIQGSLLAVSGGFTGASRRSCIRRSMCPVSACARPRKIFT